MNSDGRIKTFKEAESLNYNPQFITIVFLGSAL